MRIAPGLEAIVGALLVLGCNRTVTPQSETDVPSKDGKASAAPIWDSEAPAAPNTPLSEAGKDTSPSPPQTPTGASPDTGTPSSPAEDASIRRHPDSGADAQAAAPPPDGSDGRTPDEDYNQNWQLVGHLEQAALMSVHGTTERDVWVSGADDGNGPVVLRYNGRSWQRMRTNVFGVDLWWVHALSRQEALFGGSNATVLRFSDGRFQKMRTPGTGSERVWGVWASDLNDVYAVGSSAESDGFIWHFDGVEWSSLSLPDNTPREASGAAPGLFKVWGASPDDIWIVGGSGIVLRGSSAAGFTLLDSRVNVQLVGLAGSDSAVWTLGGTQEGVAIEWGLDGSAKMSAPPGSPMLQGAFLEPSGGTWLVGFQAVVYHRESGQDWEYVDPGLEVWPETLHSTWGDPGGNIWAVGGDIFSDMGGGVIYRRGASIATL